MKLQKFIATGSALVLALASLLSLSFSGVAEASGGTPLYWCKTSNGDFNTATNWSINANCSGGNQLPANGDNLIFDNTPINSAVDVSNDMSGLQNMGITFQGNSTAGYILSGNSLGLEFGVTDTVSPSNVNSAINLPLSLENDQTFTTSGSIDALAINQTISLGSNALILTGNTSHKITLATVTGSGSLTFSGPGSSGTYSYDLTNNNTSLSGSVTIDSLAAVVDSSTSLEALGSGTITIQSNGSLTYTSNQSSGTATIDNAFNLNGSGNTTSLGAITLCLTSSCTSGNSVLNLKGNVSLSGDSELGNAAYNGGGSANTPSVSATYNFSGQVTFSGYSLTAVPDSNTFINLPASSGSGGGSSNSSIKAPGAPNAGYGLGSNTSWLVVTGSCLISLSLIVISIGLIKRKPIKKPVY